MKSQLLQVLLYISLTGLVLAEPKCHTKEALECGYYVRDFLNTLPKGALPETPEEIDGFCGSLHQDLACWEAFMGQCTTPIQKQLESFLSEGYRNLVKEFCDNAGSKLKKDYQNHVNCMNIVVKNDNTRKNMNYMLSVLEKALGNSKAASLGLFCCGMNKMVKDMKKDAGNTCGAEVITFTEDAISSVISTLPEAICGGFDPASDKCKEVALPENSKPTGTAKNSEVYKTLEDFFGNYIPE